MSDTKINFTEEAVNSIRAAYSAAQEAKMYYGNVGTYEALGFLSGDQVL